MTNFCSKHGIRGCPASFYLSCPAYKENKNCWEVENKPCCSAQNLTKCRACPVFTKARAAAKGITP